MTEHVLAGKVAIVTGATRQRGLGRAIALCLAKAGADVVVTGASASGSLTADEQQAGWRGLASVVDEIRALCRRAHGVYVDEAQRYEPASAYARGKVEAEQEFLEAFGRGLLPVTIMRPSRVYGAMAPVRHNTGWADSTRKDAKGAKFGGDWFTAKGQENHEGRK